LRVSAKNIIPVVILFLILFAVFYALTDEIDLVLPVFTSVEEKPPAAQEEIEIDVYQIDKDRDMPSWAKPARWFRSNPGGMALEEMKSRYAALRNEYALAINYAHSDELPDYLVPYYNENHILEVRILYRKGEQLRTQWIFRDENRATRLNAVFLEPNKEEPFVREEIIETDDETAQIAEAEIEPEPETEDNIEMEIETPVILADVKSKSGFLEIFNEDSFLTEEYRYFENGGISKIEYFLKENLLIKAVYKEWNNKNSGEYITLYTDNYFYNRSLSLRNIERVFLNGQKLSDPVRVAFPRRIMDLADTGIFVRERLNVYPDFFGDVYVSKGSRMIFDTDNRGRIMSQILYNSEDKVIWAIHNTWQNNRIVSSVKTEGDTVFLAEFAYNSNGDKVLERNSKNGVLERVVRAEGNAEIEELYMDSAIVLRAVWEDGRKISETWVRN